MLNWELKPPKQLHKVSCFYFKTYQHVFAMMCQTVSLNRCDMIVMSFFSLFLSVYHYYYDKV